MYVLSQPSFFITCNPNLSTHVAADIPTIPKGTRDFSPDKMLRRNYLFHVIRDVFERFGFQPLETPAMENLSVLTGKYGDEGDQLIFKVLNSGDFAAELRHLNLSDGPPQSKQLLPLISEKALRYDLTVPFARFVAMNKGQIAFPFRRYQIQPVWRADRPQKGRYREFVQCDADVVGTPSLLCEAEIMLMINKVLQKLRLSDFTILINHRKVLKGMAEYSGLEGQELSYYTAIDKLDKIGMEGVVKELENLGMPGEKAFKHLQELNSDIGVHEFKLGHSENNDIVIGASEIEQVLSNAQHMNMPLDKIRFSPTLARGLSYYTGCIFEVKINNAQMGSISGGGRYDNLTGLFGVPGLSGVGFSLGVDRIYDVMEQLSLFPDFLGSSTTVLFCSLEASGLPFCLRAVTEARAEGIRAEIYPEEARLKKQLNYANQKKIPFAVLIGDEEVRANAWALKNLETGEQISLSAHEAIQKLKAHQANG